MNWKCELVMDLAPLYYDGVASRVSKRLVKKHLRECPQCRTYYKKYHPVDKVPTEVPNWDVEEIMPCWQEKSAKDGLCFGAASFPIWRDNCCTGVLVCKGTKR